MEIIILYSTKKNKQNHFFRPCHFIYLLLLQELKPSLETSRLIHSSANGCTFDTIFQFSEVFVAQQLYVTQI